jgi:hypothetical protein
VAALLGLVFLVVGLRLVAYELLLRQPVTVSAQIIDTGSTRSTHGGSVRFVTYRFVDASGRAHTGTSSGYGGQAGQSILVEYAPRLPFVHRVAGEGRNTSYAWRWFIAGFGLFFLIVGSHWGWTLRGQARA